MAALAVAFADGVIRDEEEGELRAFSRALGIEDVDLTALIAQHRAEVEALTPELARELLGVTEDATELEIDEAYRNLFVDLAAEDYEHIGRGLSDYAANRRTVIERAHELLKA